MYQVNTELPLIFSPSARALSQQVPLQSERLGDHCPQILSYLECHTCKGGQAFLRGEIKVKWAAEWNGEGKRLPPFIVRLWRNNQLIPYFVEMTGKSIKVQVATILITFVWFQFQGLGTLTRQNRLTGNMCTRLHNKSRTTDSDTFGLFTAAFKLRC